MLSALVLFLEDDLRQNLAGDLFAGAGVTNFELDALFDHVAKMIERDIARRLRVVEAAVRVFFYDDRTGRPATCIAQAGSSNRKRGCSSKSRQHRGRAPVQSLSATQHFSIYPLGPSGHE